MSFYNEHPPNLPPRPEGYMNTQTIPSQPEVPIPPALPTPIATPAPVPPPLAPVPPPLAPVVLPAPLPLPVISKSDSRTTVLDSHKPIGKEKTFKSSSHVTEHYAHLDKHLKEVRRKKKTNKLPVPVLGSFRSKKDGEETASIDWIGYLKAWIEYIISNASYDEIDRPLEPFSLNHVKHDVDRLYPMISPFLEPMTMIRPIYRWENKTLTGTMFGVYLFLWYFELMLSALCLAIVGWMLYVRLDMFAEYGVETLEQQPETEATIKSMDQSTWMKMKTRMKEDSDIANGMTATEWRNKLYKEYGPKTQLILSDTVDYIERMKNLATWKRPTKTRFLLVVMGLSSIALIFIPLGYVAKMIPLYVAIEFFVLQGLRSHYPRHRRLFNVINLLLWDIPNDAEYALEVVRLSHHAHSEENAPSPSPSVNSTEGLRHRQNSLLSGKSFSSMSEISDALYSSVNERASRTPQENVTLQETFTSNVKTLGLLAAASAVNKVKNTVDQKGNNEENRQTSEGEEPNSFGCMYQGTIPGRIFLHEQGFVFKTSRMTGGKILVKYAYDDIIGVKKTKQYNVGFWHANGLDISLEDGTTLKFEHVLKRDDCFNNLVSASNEEGSQWKKM